MHASRQVSCACQEGARTNPIANATVTLNLIMLVRLPQGVTEFRRSKLGKGCSRHTPWYGKMITHIHHIHYLRVVNDKSCSGGHLRRNGLRRWLCLHAAKLRLAPRIELAAGRFFDKTIHESRYRYREKHEEEDTDGTLIAQLAGCVMEIDADDHRVEQVQAVAGIPAKNKQAVLQDDAPIRTQSETVDNGCKGRR